MSNRETDSIGWEAFASPFTARENSGSDCSVRVSVGSSPSASGECSCGEACPILVDVDAANDTESLFLVDALEAAFVVLVLRLLLFIGFVGSPELMWLSLSTPL